MVHQDATGSIAVLAVLFEMSANATSPLLTAVTKNIGAITKPGTKTETGALDFSELTALLATTKLFSYQGSLTTPPCAEGLTFVVPQKPLAVDVATYLAIKQIVKFNSRYTQNTAGSTNILELGCKAKDEAGESPDCRARAGVILTLL